MAGERVAGAIQSGRLRELLRRMIDIYSPSGKEEELLEMLGTHLERQGLAVRRQPVDDKRYNILVLPDEGEAQLALVGHLDTVTAPDLENLGCSEDGGVLRGLGAADMKGGCAAAVEALLALRVERPGLPLALALVVGEEEEGDGAEALVEELHFPWAVVGEPTDLQPCSAHYGYMECELVTRGPRRHASLADNVRNPIRVMLRTLLQITDHLDDQPELIYNIRDLDSYPRGFVVPERCEAWIDLHLPPRAPMGLISRGIEEVVERAQQAVADVELDLRFAGIYSGYELAPSEPVVAALERIYSRRDWPWRPGAFRSHSDANTLWAAGIKPVLLGCGRLAEAHVPDEWVAFEQVERAAGVYRALALELFED